MFSRPLSYPLTVLVVVVAARRLPPPPLSSSASSSTSCSLLSTSEARFPPFRHCRHRSERCWRRARLKHPLLSHPLIMSLQASCLPLSVPPFSLLRHCRHCRGHRRCARFLGTYSPIHLSSSPLPPSMSSSHLPALSISVVLLPHHCLFLSSLIVVATQVSLPLPTLFPLKLTFPAVSPPGASVSRQTDSLWPRPDHATVCQVRRPPPSHSPTIFASPYPPVA